jgi:natural product biosynthesis luciferase-like monooxygenase protein
MFFASNQDALAGDKYRIVVESARFADRNRFSRIWLPERHFTKFGCLFPNPAVLHAALARETSHIGLNAGSVVLPLHDPLRVAEEWAMVDNLSGGRVGLSFASGWNPNDFALSPGNYEARHDLLFTNLEQVRKLWRGGSIPAINGKGESMAVSVFPTPLQPTLPVWITAAGNPNTYERAGAADANLLTHLLDHGIEKLAGLIDLYRRSRKRHGHDPDAGTVTVMLHTFVGSDEAQVRELVREPFCSYLKANFGLLEGLARSRGQKIDLAALSAADLDEFTRFLFERFYSSRALIGTPESCIQLVRELSGIGVDEIACLLDFGPPPDVILDHLPHLNRLRALSQSSGPPAAQRVQAPALTEVRSRCSQELTGDDFYRRLADAGVSLTGSFRCVERVWRGDGEALAEIRKPTESHHEQRSDNGYLLHPAFLDCMFQVLALAVPESHADPDKLFLPSGVRSFEVLAEPGDVVWSHAVCRVDSETRLEGDITVTGPGGELIARAQGLRLERPRAAETAGDMLLYRTEWVRAPIQEPTQEIVNAGDSAADSDGYWLIIPDSGGIAEHLHGLLSSNGQHSVISRGSEWLMRPNGQASRWRGVVHLGEWRRLLPLAGLVPKGARLWIATRGAQELNRNPVSSEAAMLWGIGRTWAAEFPDRWGGLVDLDPHTSAEACAAQLLSVIGTSDREDQTAFRGGERFAARLVRSAPIPKHKLRLRSDATYLVTGGRHGFGFEAARRLAERGARNLILLGRKPRQVSFPELEAAGASVTYAAVDVADRSALARFIGNWSGPAIRGVIHAASLWKDETGQVLVKPLQELDQASFETVLGTKSGGALSLHLATAHLALDFFVLFSSAASLVGSAGQANYAAASAALDALALRRRAEGLPALSIDWGPISEAGFGATPEGIRLHELWEVSGIGRLAPGAALDVMEALLHDGQPQAAVMSVDWAKIARSFPGMAQTPYLERLVAADGTPSRAEFLVRFDAAPEEKRRDLLLAHVGDLVAAVMQLPSGERPDPHRGLFECGLDSLMVLELKNSLQASLGENVPATLAFEHPTVSGLAEYFYARLVPAHELSAPAPRRPQSEIDRMLENLEVISDAEAEQVLRAQGYPA